uniref:Uncharacterized protein n=1 Tax=Rhizophora mucronata TaxID=61149 RepID=A0A2P2JZ45_RHIMU
MIQSDTKPCASFTLQIPVAPTAFSIFSIIFYSVFDACCRCNNGSHKLDRDAMPIDRPN